MAWLECSLKKTQRLILRYSWLLTLSGVLFAQELEAQEQTSKKIFARVLVVKGSERSGDKVLIDKKIEHLKESFKELPWKKYSLESSTEKACESGRDTRFDLKVAERELSITAVWDKKMGRYACDSKLYEVEIIEKKDSKKERKLVDPPRLDARYHAKDGGTYVIVESKNKNSRKETHMIFFVVTIQSKAFSKKAEKPK